MSSWKKVVLILMVSVFGFFGPGGATFASNIQSVSEVDNFDQNADVESTLKK